MMQSCVKETSRKFINERAEMYNAHGPEKANRLLDELYAKREAERRAEFNRVTTKPCGCHWDPGGHP